MNNLLKSKWGRLAVVIALFCVAVSGLYTDIIKPRFEKANVDTSLSEKDGQSITEDKMYVHFIDVGQGDSTLIKTPTGKFILVDAGTNSSEHELLSYLDNQNVEYIECLILTHAHEDHMGSADAVLESFYVNSVMKSEEYDECIHCQNLNYALQESVKHIDTKVYIPDMGDVYNIDGVEIKILSDGKGYMDVNDTSLCFTVEYGKSTFLFTGDAQKGVEDDMMITYGDLSAEVYKAAHHGSSTSNSEDFIDRVNPDVAVISCGEDNMYGHPHAEVVKTFVDKDAEIYRTDTDGSIVFSCTKDKISLEYLTEKVA